MNPLVFHLKMERGFNPLDTSSNLCQIISNVVCSTSSTNRYSLLSYKIPSFLNGGFQLCQDSYKIWSNTLSTVNDSTTSATMTSQILYLFFHKVYINVHKTCTMNFIGPSKHVYYAAISTPYLYCDLYKICTHFTCSYANSRDDHSLTISWLVSSFKRWNQSIFCLGLRVSPNSRSYPSFISWANLATDLTHPLFHWIHLQYVTKCKPQQITPFQSLMITFFYINE